MQKRQFLKTLAFVPASAVALPAVFASTRPQTVQLQRSIVRGFAYYQGNQVLNKMQINDSLTLQREPENKHDKKAITVYWQNTKLGYLARDENTTLAQILDAGQTITAHIENIIPENDWEPLDVVV